jgi:hypothetical protein
MKDKPPEVVVQIADQITADLFSLGDELGSPCCRIEFKGKTEDIEFGMGGLNKDAFRDFVADSLRALLAGEIE